MSYFFKIAQKWSSVTKIVYRLLSELEKVKATSFAQKHKLIRAMYTFKCCDCSATYIEWIRSTLPTEHKRATGDADVKNHIAELHLQKKHQIDRDSATCITYSTDYYQRLTLESWFTNLEQTPVVFSLRQFWLGKAEKVLKCSENTSSCLILWVFVDGRGYHGRLEWFVFKSVQLK